MSIPSIHNEPDIHPYNGSMHFAKKLQEIRTEKDLSQRQLAKKIGVSPIYVSKWERGMAHPSLPVFVNLIKALGISADYFLLENVPREGVAAIDDFELYEFFRKTENLPKDKKEWIKGIVNAVVFQEKVQEIPESSLPATNQTRTPALRKVAGKR